jgi:DNA-binding NarL/FixJ family response regulator
VNLAATPIRALLIEDNPGDARLIREMLRDAGGASAAVVLAHADRLAPGLQQLAEQVTDVVLLDLTLPDSQGFETFATVHTQAPDVAIVVLSGLDDETLAVRAVQEGAQDYLVKGQVDGGAILRSMRYAIERQRLETVRRDLSLVQLAVRRQRGVRAGVPPHPGQTSRVRCRAVAAPRA